MRTLTLVLLLALGGCGTFNKPTACSGPTFKLNQEHWDQMALGNEQLATGAYQYHE